MTAPPPAAARRVVRLRLDPGARRIDGGRVLVGGSPLRLLRLSEAGGRVLDRIGRGEPVPVSSLVDRLLDAGIAHPVAEPPGPFTAADVTAVIPTYGGDVRPIVAALPHGSTAPMRVVVVDDASLDGPRVPEATTVLWRATNGGPGAARTDGLAATTTALALFVDDDVTLPTEPDWLDPLLAHFADPAVALVAPRVRSTPGVTLLARYERDRSPLDLGPASGPVRPRTRISYVPAAVVVARVDALRAIGGFDLDLRYGEDVDLVWRLDAAGWRVRYEASVEVAHAPRATWRAWARQRAAYGSSAAPLSLRHPGALAPVAVSAWSAAAWAAVATGTPLGIGAGLLAAAGSTAALAKPLGDLDHPAAEAMRLAGRGHLGAGRLLADGVRRAWWPLAIAAAVVSRRARRAVVAAALLPPTRPARWTLLRLADDLAYGWGLWQGCRRQRTLAPLRPDLTSWPRPPKLGRSRPSGAPAGR